MMPLYKPYMPELPELQGILHSGQLACGAYTARFEDALRAYFGVPRLAAVNSFESGIRVVLSALSVGTGDEAVASPMACLASTQPYRAAGMKLVWADVDPGTGTLDPDSVRQKVTRRTKVIVHNHFCGYPGYVDEVNRIGAEYGIPVIDDGIECFGSTYKGRKIGNCGTDITVFSFSAVRLPNTVDGGAILFKDRDLYEKSLLIRDCGIDRAKFRDGDSEINPDCDIALQGYSATMSNVNGYIGLRQMEDVGRLIGLQRRNAAKWRRKLEGTQYLEIGRGNGMPNYWIYGIRAEDKQKALHDFREQGYYASGVHVNNNRYSLFGGERTLPGVREFYRHFLALPCGWWIGERDI